MVVRDITEKLLEIEKEFAVESCEYRGVWIWPLLRLTLLNSARGRGLAAAFSAENQKRRLKNVGSKIPSLLVEDRTLDLIEELDSRAEILFFSQIYHCVEFESNLHFHRFFDPLAKFIERTGSTHTSFLNLNDAGEDSASIFRSGPFIDSLIDAVRNEVKLGFRGEEVSSQPISEILNSWNQQFPQSTVAISGFIEECEALYRLATILASVIPASVRSVFLCCFYSPFSFALSLACQFRGIQCVELQHGQQGDWHPMYTHWMRVPKKELRLIPSVFWMWGETGVERINRWGEESGIKAIKGGNPWLYSINEATKCIGSSGSVARTGAANRILVSMQNLELPDFVWQTISESGDREWCFRLHPRFTNLRSHVEERCAEIFRGRNELWSVSNPSDSEFYSVVATHDLHVTGWSTTAYEALALGVPTVLIHKNGREAMTTAIEDGVFGYVETAPEFHEFLSKPPRGQEARPTIECGERVLENGLAELSALGSRGQGDASIFKRPAKEGRRSVGSELGRLRRRIEFAFNSSGPVNIRIGNRTSNIRGWIPLNFSSLDLESFLVWHRLFRGVRIGRLQVDYTASSDSAAKVGSLIRRARRYLGKEGLLRVGVQPEFRSGEPTFPELERIAEKLSMEFRRYESHSEDPGGFSKVWDIMDDEIGMAGKERPRKFLVQEDHVVVCDLQRKRP